MLQRFCFFAGQASRSTRGLSAVDPAAVPVNLDPVDSPLTPTTQLPLQERARQVPAPYSHFLDASHVLRVVGW